MLRRQLLARRAFLKASGVAVALPMLESTHGAMFARGQTPKRMVLVCNSLGLHAPNLFPKSAGKLSPETPYLKILSEHLGDLTIFSSLSHPDQAGADGHSSEQTWLTSARNPGLGGFRNSISIDQLAAERLGSETRFPSLVLGTHAGSQSYSRSGVMIPADDKPSVIFKKLFIEGTPQEVQQQLQELAQGRSILDTVKSQADKLQKRSSAADREKLEEYLSSIRELEVRLQKSEAWIKKPKPKVNAEAPHDIANESDTIGRTKLLFDLIPLALKSDSTRVITLLIHGRNDVPPVPGVSIDHHNLSHHGQDPQKIKQLSLIEEAEFKTLAGLLEKLKQTSEGEHRLLDQTMVLFGSNLGNANAHDPKSLPLVFAGGGFKHGSYVADAKKQTPFANLFVTMLNQLGVPCDSFGTSTGALSIG